MKIRKYFSILSILITLFFLVQKILFDIKIYHLISDELKNGDMSPILFAGGKATLIYLVPLSVALILSVIGLIRKNKFRILAFIFNLITLIYLVIPVGLLLATMG